MATTRLGVTATPGRSYGSFAGKVAASISREGEFTRLGVTATPGRRYGSFAGKVAAVIPREGEFTRLSVAAVPGRRYGDFSGKVAAVVPEEVIGTNYGGSAWLASQAHRDRLLREDEEIMNLITSLVLSGALDGR